MTFYMTTPYEVVCAHCGSPPVMEGELDHMCMGVLFDWLEALDGQKRAREYGELMALMQQFETAL